MTKTDFVKQADGSYMAEITGVTANINVDIERDAAGIIVIQQKAASATRYKSPQTIKDAKRIPDLNFNIIQEAGTAELDYKIISKTPVTNFVVA